MDIKECLKNLEASSDYSGWRAGNPGFYLAHVFFMTGQPLQLGYYGKESETMVTFDIADGKVTLNPASEVFKEKGHVEGIDLEKAGVSMDRALLDAENTMKENYPKELKDRTICILQKIDGRQVYNITFITKSFNTINIRVDSGSGEVISHDLKSLISMA